MRILTVIALSVLALTRLSAQIGGDNVYGFLDINHSAFAAATGGMTVSQGLGDLSLPYFNPALLSNSMDNDISLSFSSYFAGITYGYASLSGGTRGKRSLAGGISFISYGKFTGADASGNITGSFTGSEYALNFIYSSVIDSYFTAGINNTCV